MFAYSGATQNAIRKGQTSPSPKGRRGNGFLTRRWLWSAEFDEIDNHSSQNLYSCLLVVILNTGINICENVKKGGKQ